MSHKTDFLHRLAARIESAQKRADADPGNLQHEMYVGSLRLLYRDLQALPENHRLFRDWRDDYWQPTTLSDSPEVMTAYCRRSGQS